MTLILSSHQTQVDHFDYLYKLTDCFFLKVVVITINHMINCDNNVSNDNVKNYHIAVAPSLASHHSCFNKAILKAALVNILILTINVINIINV